MLEIRSTAARLIACCTAIVSLAGCGSPSGARAGADSPAPSPPRLLSMPLDSARIGEIAIKEFRRRDPLDTTAMRVLRIEKVPDGYSGYDVIVIPRSPMVGGGGEVRVGLDGFARLVRRHQ